MKHFFIGMFVALLAAAPASQPSVAPLPASTSQYNQGNAPGRYRDEAGKIRRFQLKASKRSTDLYDGDGRVIGETSAPTMLNVGAFKQMKVDGRQNPAWFGWAWKTDAAVSGWIALDAIVDPPKVQIDAQRNPKPPKESDTPLKIDAASGLKQLAD